MLTEKQVLEIKENGLYDFACNNHWKISKDLMKELFKEFNYAVYCLDRKLESKAVDLMLKEIGVSKEYD